MWTKTAKTAKNDQKRSKQPFSVTFADPQGSKNRFRGHRPTRPIPICHIHPLEPSKPPYMNKNCQKLPKTAKIAKKQPKTVTFWATRGSKNRFRGHRPPKAITICHIYPPEPSKPSCMAKNGQKRPKTAKNSKIGHFPLLSGRLRRLKIDFWSKSCLDHQYTPEIYQQQKIWAKSANSRSLPT